MFLWDSPAPVGDPRTGRAGACLVKRPAWLARTVTPIPSGGSPDGTGGSPVLPKEDFETSSEVTSVVNWPGVVNWMTPPQAHTHLLRHALPAFVHGAVGTQVNAAANCGLAVVRNFRVFVTP